MMYGYGESLPNWFWSIYWLLTLITIGTAIRYLLLKKMQLFSIIVIVISVSIPIAGMLNSVPRPDGMNEFEHIFNMLQEGAMWSIYITFGYAILLIWWLLIAIKIIRNRHPHLE
jgi:hypothetical protein